VKANHAFAKGGLTDDKIDAIVAACCSLVELRRPGPRVDSAGGPGPPPGPFAFAPTTSPLAMIAFLRSPPARLWRPLVVTPSSPTPTVRWPSRGPSTQDGPEARATVAMLARQQSRRLFGVGARRRGIQARCSCG